jgi:hypothetical protein
MPAERTDLLPGPVSEALTAQTGGREGARDGERTRRMAAVLGGLGRVETGLASQAARRVSPGYFRLALADAQRYDDVTGNFPV